MIGYGSVLSVFWDADSLFRLASTKLPEERSATLTILRLAMLGLLISVTSMDALVEARRSLRNVCGRKKGDASFGACGKWFVNISKSSPRPYLIRFKLLSRKSPTLPMH